MANQTDENLNHGIVSEFLRELTDDDFKKILFLVIDTKDLSSYESLIMESARMRKQVEYTFAQCGWSLIPETLMAIKKYAYLKRFNICKHQNNSNTQGYVEIFRKFLFSICEELADDDVSYVKKKLNLGKKSFASAECLMCRLLVQNIISEKSLKNLENVFKKNPSKYGDILKKFDEFYESVRPVSTSDESSSNDETSSSEDELMVYPVKFSRQNKTCGVAVIFNQVKFKKMPERTGSDRDRDELRAVWKNYGFDVICHENLEADEIEKEFQNLACRQYERPSIFVACLLSHGNEGGVIFGSDDEPVQVQSIIDKIANNCQSLYGMPKLFFIQACKGKTVQEGLVLDSPNSTSHDVDEYDFDGQRIIPRMCDTFIAYATVEGYASLRSKDKGSVFVQALTKYLVKHGEKDDIDVIMKRVINSIAAMELKVKANPPLACGRPILLKQMPEYCSTLRGKLKFKKPVEN